MKQTPAAVLILSASICSYAAAMRADDSFGAMIGLAAIGLGMWGTVSLINACMENRGFSRAGLGEAARTSPADPLSGLLTHGGEGAASRQAMPSTPGPTARRATYERNHKRPRRSESAADRPGRERSDMVEETLRRHLARYTRSVTGRAATDRHNRKSLSKPIGETCR